MAETYMKAVEWDKLSAAFKKTHSQRLAASYGMWLQRKYDGCYGKAYIEKDRSACYMHSRTGEDYSASCAHILDELHILAADDESPVVLLGEVWAAGVKFPDISGMFRRQGRGPQMALSFVIHDILDPDMATHVSYTARFDDLGEFVLEGPPQPHIMIAETYRQGEWDGDPLEWAVKWKAEGGYDGAILRDPLAPYTPGLVKNGEVVKVKPVMSLDIEVVGVYHETGEKTGRMVHTIEVMYLGAVSKVGSGVPHALVDLPTVTDIVQIDCMGLTEDGKLREPRFICIRHDKTVPDA